MGWGILTKLIDPVIKVFNKRTERKMAKESAQAKLSMAKVTGDQNLKMTDAEWEALSLQTQVNSWKDEFVTVVILFPFIGLLVGAVYGTVTGNMAVLEGVKLALAEIKNLDTEYWELTKIVVLAAVGLKLWRDR